MRKTECTHRDKRQHMLARTYKSPARNVRMTSCGKAKLLVVPRAAVTSHNSTRRVVQRVIMDGKCSQPRLAKHQRHRCKFLFRGAKLNNNEKRRRKDC